MAAHGEEEEEELHENGVSRHGVEFSTPWLLPAVGFRLLAALLRARQKKLLCRTARAVRCGIMAAAEEGAKQKSHAWNDGTEVKNLRSIIPQIVPVWRAAPY